MPPLLRPRLLVGRESLPQSPEGEYFLRRGVGWTAGERIWRGRALGQGGSERACGALTDGRRLRGIMLALRACVRSRRACVWRATAWTARGGSGGGGDGCDTPPRAPAGVWLQRPPPPSHALCSFPCKLHKRCYCAAVGVVPSRVLSPPASFVCPPCAAHARVVRTRTPNPPHKATTAGSDKMVLSGGPFLFARLGNSV